MRRLMILAGLAVLGCGWGCEVMPEGGPMVSETIEETYELAADGRVKLQNVNGKITVEAWDRAEVHLRAEKHAAGEEALEEVQVKISADEDRVDIRTEISNGPTGWFKNLRQRVDYQLTVPEGARISLNSVNGRVTVEDLLGRADVNSVNGAVHCLRLDGELDVSSVNGAITVELPEDGSHGNVSLSAVNGGISIVTPAGAGGELSARTVNGGIRSDVPFDRNEKGFGPMKRVNGTFGAGGPDVQVKTVNGGIRIRAPKAETGS